jgi:hypothetical protein
VFSSRHCKKFLKLRYKTEPGKVGRVGAKESGKWNAMKKDKDQDAPKRQAIREQIDENLRRVYTATLNEELPDRFRDLLEQLKRKGADNSADKGSSE